VPGAPENQNQFEAFEFQRREGQGHRKQEQRRKDEARSKASKENGIRVGADEARKVMPGRPDGKHHGSEAVGIVAALG